MLSLLQRSSGGWLRHTLRSLSASGLGRSKPGDILLDLPPCFDPPLMLSAGKRCEEGCGQGGGGEVLLLWRQGRRHDQVLQWLRRPKYVLRQSPQAWNQFLPRLRPEILSQPASESDADAGRGLGAAIPPRPRARVPACFGGVAKEGAGRPTARRGARWRPVLCWGRPAGLWCLGRRRARTRAQRLPLPL